MNPLRLLVLAVAVVAGGVAAYLSMGNEPAPAPVQIAAPTVKTTEVLVAGIDIPMGTTVGGPELRWQIWPQDGAAAGMIIRNEQPNAQQEFSGAIARTQILAGEPIRRERLVKTGQGGVLSALLPQGSRAIAITIDTRGANSAGGFVLPNDHVDIIRTYRDEAASKATGTDVIMTETLLRNVRVLAIGQNIQERNGEKVVVGETATLELDPKQVELILLAQRMGQLSLALRSLQDTAKVDENAAARLVEDTTLTVVRFGASSQR